MDRTNRLVYTVGEVANMLGLSESYTYRLAKARKIPVLQLGRRMVIPKEKFEIWLNESPEIE